MFLESVFTALFWIFSIFGLFSVLRMLCSFYLIKKCRVLKSEIVVKFKNDEETIENTVRLLAEEIFFTSREKMFLSLTAVDMGSGDESANILRRLQKEYPFIKIVSREEYFSAL